MNTRVLVRDLLLLSGVITLLFAGTGGASAAPSAQTASAQSGGVLCLPGVYRADPGGCTAAGPSAYLGSMAQRGMLLPLAALPAFRPDPNLSNVNVRYGLVRTANAPVYGSVEDAVDGVKRNAVRRIDSPFSYISYTDETVVGGKRLYMVEPGEWMTAADVIRIGAVPRFQGVTLTRTPENAFGWVLTYLTAAPAQPKRTPGYAVEDYTGKQLNNQEIVQVYAVEQINGEDWYQIGPDEWLPHQMVARVLPNSSPPAGVDNGRWIEVNLDEQTLAVYDGGRMVFATLIASGLDPFWTRPGLFRIASKIETTPMRGSFEADRSDAYYLEDVPWTMYFDEARALHGAYWRTQLGFPQSHGCVNLSVGDARWLFEWAQQGDWVYVWDPSGKTPTDPKLYTPGGA
jgi:lipoprotein-anchoring transpeptidase ErfK/SrfK